MVQLQTFGTLARADVTNTTSPVPDVITMAVRPRTVKAGGGGFRASPSLGCQVTTTLSTNASSAANSYCSWSSSNSSYVAPLLLPGPGAWNVSVQLWHPDNPALYTATRTLLVNTSIPLATAASSSMALRYNGTRVGDRLYAVLTLKNGLGLVALGVANVALTVSCAAARAVGCTCLGAVELP